MKTMRGATNRNKQAETMLSILIGMSRMSLQHTVINKVHQQMIEIGDVDDAGSPAQTTGTRGHNAGIAPNSTVKTTSRSIRR
jgi:hypothetical protein